MIQDLQSPDVPDRVDTEVCVVGAGAAGITLSVTLARQGADVVMLESGGRVHDPKIHALNAGEVVGHSHSGILQGRFRGLGGTTVQAGGQTLPLHPIDFEYRPWILWSGWPIPYAALELYYARALSFVGLDRARVTDSAVWQAIGREEPRLGDLLTPYLSRWCPQPSFASRYGDEIERLSSLRCVLRATVTIISATGERITSLMATGLHGRRMRVRARTFIFCVGGIETPRLLLQPLDDGTSPPWAASAILGGFFQDHPHRLCAEVIPRDRRAVHDLFDQIYLGGMKYQPRMRLSENFQRQMRSLNAGGIVLFETAKGEILHEARTAGRALLGGTLSGSTLRRATKVALTAMPLVATQAWRLLVQRRSYNPDDLGFNLGVQIEQPPRPESRVSLGAEVDALGVRRARLNWCLGKEEIATIALFAEAVKQSFEHLGIGEVRIHPDVLRREGAVLDRVSDYYHHMGTARMAEQECCGVVTPDLRMFHAENAYICSTAVFPTSGYSNPTHTLIALALRLADYLQGKGFA